MNRRRFLKSTVSSLAALPFCAMSLERARGAASSPRAARRPNILFCIADDASRHFGAYGCDWVRTPGLDRVAREGVRFTNAYTPNAKCAPSRACILTGRNSWQLEEAANHMCAFPPHFKSYVEALDGHGYFVGKTGKGWAPGVAVDRQGKPRHMAGTPFDKHKATPPATRISSNDYAANFEAFLNARPTDRPFCFWYGAFEPHRSYEYGSGVAKGGKRLQDIDRVPAYWPDNEVIRNDMLDYAFEVEHFDRHVHRMLELLEKHGELDNTLVVVTSDHGMPFPRVKGQEYERSNHIPLAIMWKRGVKHPGRVVNDFVSFIDLAPTFLEVAGLPQDQSGMASITGRSLTDILYSDRQGQVNPRRDHVLIGKERHDVGRPGETGYPIRAILKDDLLYLRNFEPSRWPVGNPECGYPNCDGSPTKTEILNLRRSGTNKKFWQQSFGKRPAEELYDLTRDPDCVVNLAEDPTYADRKAALKQQMLAELKEQGDPRMFGRGEVFDRYPFGLHQWDDFYERRYVQGQNIRMGWISQTDFDPNLVD